MTMLPLIGLRLLVWCIALAILSVAVDEVDSAISIPYQSDPIDLGVLEEGVAEVPFRISMPIKELNLRKVSASCGCIKKVSFENAEGLDEELAVSLLMDTTQRDGNFRNSLIFDGVSPVGRVRWLVPISYSVNGVFGVLESNLQSTYELGKPGRAVFKIKVKGAERIELSHLDHDVNLKWIKKEKDTYEVTMEFDSSRLGIAESTIQIKSLPSGRSHAMPLSWMVESSRLSR